MEMFHMMLLAIAFFAKNDSAYTSGDYIDIPVNGGECLCPNNRESLFCSKYKGNFGLSIDNSAIITMDVFIVMIHRCIGGYCILFFILCLQL